MNPKHPVYIPSKGRATTATTPKFLDQIGVPYRLVVEREQWDEYEAVYGAKRLLELPKVYQDEYDTCDDLGDTKSKGPGPARNFAWQHAIGEGHAWHWVMDDNIMSFAVLRNNQRVTVGDGHAFAAMEEFCGRYKNIGEAGPEYLTFVHPRYPHKPYLLNHRVFSCNLIRNDVEVRWHGRYNEDLLLAIAMLYAGWCTVTFKAFLQHKMRTQTIGGGNTEEFYAKEGTYNKSMLAVRKYPDIVRLVHRFGRAHHAANFNEFKNMRLVLRDDYEPTKETQFKTKLATKS